MDWIAELTRAAITSGAALIASYFGAKWAESRKLQARFEKLDKIREEMREVTRVQEEIKRQLQGGEWNRQTLWKQQLESYTELLRLTTDYLDGCYGLRSSLSSGSAPSSDLETRNAQLRRTRADTFKAVSVVEIFGNSEVLAALKRFFQIIGEAQDGHNAESVNSLSHEIQAIRELQTSFVAAAREQLRGSIDH